MIEDRRSFTGYSKKLKAQGKLTTVSNTIHKVLMQTHCKICGVQGMAYQDPNELTPRDHYCEKHNPLIHKKKELPNYLGTKRCKEPSCQKLFNNNGRNAHADKEFCSSNCCSIYGARLANQEKRNER